MIKRIIQSLVFRGKNKLAAVGRTVEIVKIYLMKGNEDQLNFITGANHTHYKSLFQFISSLGKYEKIENLIFYDLGLTTEQEMTIREQFPQLKYKRFDYSKYPSYFDISVNFGEYAWKPVIIYSELIQSNSPIIWLDAGCVITEPLNKVRKIIKAIGIYTPSSAGTIADWTHAGMLDYLGIKEGLLRKTNLHGAVVGINNNSPEARKLIEQWKDCALDKNCIAPPGSSRKNHRQDQAALTVLAWKAGIAKRIPRQLYGIRTHCDVN